MQKTKNLPLISIIIPIYNAENFLAQAINSCLNQTYPNLEIILVNDGSTDSSAKICQNFLSNSLNTKKISKIPHCKNHQSQTLAKKRFFHFINLPHQGVSTARNCGLQKSTGEFFCFLDADDLLMPSFIYELYSFARAHHLQYVSSEYLRIIKTVPSSILTLARQTAIEKTSRKKIYTQKEFFVQLLDLNSGYNFCHMKLIHKDLRVFRFNQSLKVAEDALYNFTILKHLSNIGIVKKPLYIYRIHKNSTVRTFDTEYIKNYQTALQTIKNYLIENYPDFFEQFQKYFQAFVISHLFLILTNYYCHQNNHAKISSIKSLYKIPLFSQAIYLAPLFYFPFSKSLVLFCFKFRLYYFLKIIGIIRSKQNSYESSHSQKPRITVK